MDHLVTCCKLVCINSKLDLVFKRGRFWPFLGVLFLKKSDAMYFIYVLTR